MQSATPAACASRRASAIAAGWTSFARIAPRAGRRAARASSTRRGHSVGSASAQRRSGGGARMRPGAVSVAMSAASMGSVAEPHIGSQSVAPPSASAAYPAWRRRPAANVSLSAAAWTAER